MQTAPEPVSMPEASTTPAPFELIIPPSGEIVARDVSWEDFLANKNWEHVEWVDGWVVKMPGINERHDGLQEFFHFLLRFFLELSGVGGRVFRDPMLMKPFPHLPGRAPDIMVLFGDRLHLVGEKAVEGAADIVIEIVSPKGEKRDRIEKFREYEAAGVKEYWVIDYRFHDAEFYVLNIDGVFERAMLESNEVYRSPHLHHFGLSINILWREVLPNARETLAMVEAMLAAADTMPSVESVE
ncbi:MAG: Uma2 family endonuclease [Chloroflexota bacterium]|nr:Uma2 family endonuclease [Chloroflexota bacterium]